MTKNSAQEVFTHCITVALEDWAMMLIEPTDNEDILGEYEGILIGTMQFRGVMDGTIAVLARRSFAEVLCMNLLGLSPDEVVDEVQCHDALKELTNVLAGNFLTEAYGDDTVFELVYPSVIRADEFLPEYLARAKLVQSYEADGENISFLLGPLNTFTKE